MLVAPKGQGWERRTGRGGGGATCSGARSRASRGHPSRVDAVANSSTFVALLERARQQRAPAAGDPRVRAVPGATQGLGGRTASDRGQLDVGSYNLFGAHRGSSPFDRSGTVGAAAELTGRIYVA